MGKHVYVRKDPCYDDSKISKINFVPFWMKMLIKFTLVSFFVVVVFHMFGVTTDFSLTFRICWEFFNKIIQTALEYLKQLVFDVRKTSVLALHIFPFFKVSTWYNSLCYGFVNKDRRSFDWFTGNMRSLLPGENLVPDLSFNIWFGAALKPASNTSKCLEIQGFPLAVAVAVFLSIHSAVKLLLSCKNHTTAVLKVLTFCASFF